MQYKLTNKSGQTAVIEAERYEQDGSGVRFYDADGNMTVSYYDGLIRSVEPADIEWQ